MNQHHALPQLPTLFLVGGTGRFVGKTTFAELLIEHFSKDFTIIAVKISNIKPGDQAVHGWHGDALTERFLIEEEASSGNQKDTQRFLAAGAKRAFFIRAFEEALPEAVTAFFEQVSPNTLLVCESNTLRNYYDPGAMVMVTDEEKPISKAESIELLEKAEVVLKHFDKSAFKKVIDGVSITGNKWSITK